MARELPSPEQFVTRQINQSTKIYDRTGNILLYEVHGEEKRTVISFDQIPDYVKEATIAVEDQEFYEHPAFDWKSLMRAAFVDLTSGRATQGGSTITQQLAKNAFLSSDKTITRKIKELILANWIEQRYTKDQILNLYLNQIPYGASAYGIEAASETYFGKQAKDLDLAESALLAALPQAPSYYSPWGSHQEELMQRKNYALDQMAKLGYITDEQKMSAQKEKLDFLSQNLGSIKAPHFVMMVRDYLIGKYGEDVVQTSGLKVITTLDMNLQTIAEQAVRDGASRNTQLYNGHNAALVAEDPKTGQILALVGSKDYFGASEPNGCNTTNNECLFEGNFNVASQGLRQPGSSFKPYAYVTAFEQGYTPDSIVFDLPTEFSTDYQDCPLINIDYNASSSPNSPCFHPENFDHTFRGPVSLRNALAQSINVPSVKVLYLVGIENAIKTAQDFGITTLTDPRRYGLSLVLGGGEVKLDEMVGAYSVFAQDGTKHDQALILEVDDSSGQTLEKFTDQSSQVIDPQYVRLINDVLTDVNARTPLFQASLNLTTFPDREVALKTGTTNNYKDAWAIGYMPSLVVGVWAGNNNSQPMQRQGGSILAAVPIWHDFLSQALSYFPTETFPTPNPVATTKPILNGQYIVNNNEVHDILYYVDKSNPLGSAPLNPLSDPQYLNWQTPLIIWAKNQNLITDTFSGQASSTSTSSRP